MNLNKQIERKNFTPNRDDYILKKCENKKVLHVGACDWPFTEKKFITGKLLFSKIDDICEEQLGIDLDIKSINFLNSKKFKTSIVVEHDMNSDVELSFIPDIIIFGETLEHLTNPGVALDNLKRMMNKKTELVVSVPNALCLKNFISGFFGKEYQHPDHSLAFTYKTLCQLLIKKDLDIKEINFTFLGDGIKGLGLRGRVAHFLTKSGSRFFPLFSPTIVISVKLK